MYQYTTQTKKLLGDLYTPVGVYMSLRDLYPQSVLMESSDYHSHDTARSFIGIHPMAKIVVNHGVIESSYPDGRHETQAIDQSVKGHAKLQLADALADFIQHFEVKGDDCEYCGLYGFASFNAVRYFEDIDVKDSVMKENDAPDILYILYRDLIVFDHFNNTITLITLGGSLDEIEKNLNHPARSYDFHSAGSPFSMLSDEAHKENIRKCVSHCLRGDVFQVVVSRRFCQKYDGDDFNLYRALRSVNPSPYLFYFDFGGFRIFGSSPETHCRIEGAKAWIDPIAGTTKRTGNPAEDKANAEYLRNDPKENAEHVMLVDLARNDLSRNCTHVGVDFYKDMQFYSHVIHLVSRVSGTLVGQGVGDKLRAFIDTFPAGTLSGAPKVRAMQIISELEPHNRGAYGGCIGFIGLNGDLNQAIVIRTFVSRNGELWFQAGSGVVAKSNDEYELQEVDNKLGALVKAIKIAEGI
ncbi:anthranilate synthase component I family protein [Prevotella sp. KH2C16]|uniref:anthranilate synthase component I family protein n=1 Tax=Prevotella sp. KH2C16 TaxID=1855325 RepID=UPI0008E7258C|nr:anthranilate synthase component I family protein [Prevotella sp. KH2C16]SFF93538.1 anthranilate synthase component 1 [Prevotella sp. KH2C16]